MIRHTYIMPKQKQQWNKYTQFNFQQSVSSSLYQK